MSMFKKFLSSVIGSSGSSDFPYEIGKDAVEVVGWKGGYWHLYEGTRKSDGAKVSVFKCDVGKLTNEEAMLARNGVKMLRTRRHPNVLKHQADNEIDGTLFLVTEKITPLTSMPSSLGVDHSLYGSLQVATAVAFLNNECAMMHGFVHPTAIFVTESLDWKLGYFDYGNDGTDSTMLQAIQRHFASSPQYQHPLLQQAAWSSIQNARHCIDTFAFGSLLDELVLSHTSNSQVSLLVKKLHVDRCPPLHANMWKNVHTGYSALIHSIDELNLKDEGERYQLYTDVEESAGSLPPELIARKLFPHLLTMFDSGPAAEQQRLVQLAMALIPRLDAPLFQECASGFICRLFRLPDRGIRITLLKSMGEFGHLLSEQDVRKEVFPNMVNGFTDTSPMIRELTVKSVLHIVPKMDEKALSSQLLRYFATLQTDQEPGIRTNTAICLGRVAPYLSPATRKNVLAAAFQRPLKDSFAPARTAALKALAATKQYYLLADLARRVVPSVSPLLVDAEPEVKTAAMTLIRQCLQRIESGVEDEAVEKSEGSEVPDSTSGKLLQWAANSFSSVGSAIRSKISRNKEEPSGSATPTESAPAVSSSTSTSASASAPSSTPMQPQVPRRPTTTTTATATATTAFSSNFMDETDGWGDIDVDVDQVTPAAAAPPPRPTRPPAATTTFDDYEDLDPLSNKSTTPATTRTTTATAATTATAPDSSSSSSSSKPLRLATRRKLGAIKKS